MERIETIVRGLNNAYGKTSQLKEIKEKYTDLLPLIASFCTAMGASTFNEHCFYTQVNRWSEVCEEKDVEGNMVIFLRRNSKDSPRALTPCPVPESPHKEKTQIFIPLEKDNQDVSMDNTL